MSASATGSSFVLPIPPPITATFDFGTASLESLHSLITVSSTLRTLVDTVDERLLHVEIEQLQQIRRSVTSDLSAQRSEWQPLSQQINIDTAALVEQEQQLTAAIASTEASVSTVSSQLSSGMRQDQQYFASLASSSLSVDLSLLPAALLSSHLACYLRPRDLGIAVRVCRRWHQLLDSGLVWRVLCVQLVETIVQQRREQATLSSTSSSSSSPATAPSLSLTFTPLQLPTKPRSVLSKQEALRAATAIHQRNVDVVMREFEQLSSKQGDEGNEKSLLRVMVDIKRDEVGKKRVMIGEMDDRTEAMRRDRAAKARSIKAMEAELNVEREKKRLMRAEHGEAVRWFEGRVSRVRALEGGGSRREERDNLIQKKDVLVRGVEGLQRDMKRVTVERDEYEEKIRQLRHKIKQVAW